MNRILLALCAVLLIVGTTGCGCCRNFFGSRTTAAKPVCGPVGPSCSAGCNSCNAGCNSCSAAGGADYGQPMTYPAVGATMGEGAPQYPMMPLQGG